MIKKKAHFKVTFDKKLSGQWALGGGLAHWGRGTYLFINLIKLSISIGYISKVEPTERDSEW